MEVRLKSGMWKIAQGKPSPDYDGWILVEPEKKWVLREYELGHRKQVIRGLVEYGDPQDGFPLPKRVVIKGFPRGSSEPTFIQIFTFEDLRFVDVPDGEFTLAAFGLPELGQPGRSRSRYANRTVFWLLGAALVSLVLAVALKYYSGTSRRTPPEPVPGAV